MSALPVTKVSVAASLADAAIDALPEEVVGVGEWGVMATRNLVAHFAAAAESGQAYRVANAVRAMAHVPSHEELAAVIRAVCGAIAGSSLRRRSEWQRVSERVELLREVAFETLSGIGTVDLTHDADGADATISALLGLIALRRTALADRLQTVGALARRIGTRMALDVTTLQRLARASALYDVGLMSEPEPEESGPEHVLAGTRYLQSLPALAELADIVRAHHERYDGTGFPDGLAAESIPIEARVIAAADAFHRAASALEDQIAGLSRALEEIRSGSGTRFDPVIVAAISQLMVPGHKWTSRSA